MKNSQMNITIKEDNFPKLQKVIDDLGRYALSIGIFGEDDTGDESYVMIANVHEFGITIALPNGEIRVPERSFMRSTFEEKEREWTAFIEERLDRVLAFQMSVEQMYEQMGAKVVSDIQNKIRTLDTPENAESTIKKKRSSNPLIDKGGAGGLITRVTWKVIRE
ncbi:hypothetical protein [Virgibacillus sediminis]|uniref:Uncharacterized protein n=1 Tax=Virgibacillus sediminis TaxID=202260 RepID=A0ABV7A686_9BACI